MASLDTEGFPDEVGYFVDRHGGLWANYGGESGWQIVFEIKAQADENASQHQ